MTSQTGNLEGQHISGKSMLQIAMQNPEGDIDMQNQYKVINMIDPSNAQDAATKNYVDNQISGSSQPLNVTSTSNPNTGNVDMNNYKIINMVDPTNAQDASTKAYVDTAITNIQTDRIISPDTNSTLIQGNSNLVSTIQSETAFTFTRVVGDHTEMAMDQLDININKPNQQQFVQVIAENNNLASNQAFVGVYQKQNGASVNNYTGGLIFGNNGSGDDSQGILASGQYNLGGGMEKVCFFGGQNINRFVISSDATTIDSTGPTLNMRNTALDGLQIDSNVKMGYKSNLTVADITENNQFPTKEYIDTQISSVGVPLNTISANYPTSGSVDLNSNKLINVSDPTNAQDAATKNYTDTAISNYVPTYIADAGSNTTLTATNTNLVAKIDGSIDVLSIDRIAGQTVISAPDVIELRATNMAVEVDNTNSKINLVNTSGNYLQTYGALNGLGLIQANLESQEIQLKSTDVQGKILLNTSLPAEYVVHPTFSSDNDLVSKKYVDDAISAGGGGDQINDSGSNTIVLANPTNVNFKVNGSTNALQIEQQGSTTSLLTLANNTYLGNNIFNLLLNSSFGSVDFSYVLNFVNTRFLRMYPTDNGSNKQQCTFQANQLQFISDASPTTSQEIRYVTSNPLLYNTDITTNITNNNHIPNKKYVDDLFNSISGNKYASYTFNGSIAGGSFITTWQMTWDNIGISQNGTTFTLASNKQYEVQIYGHYTATGIGVMSLYIQDSTNTNLGTAVYGSNQQYRGRALITYDNSPNIFSCANDPPLWFDTTTYPLASSIKVFCNSNTSPGTNVIAYLYIRQVN